MSAREFANPSDWFERMPAFLQEGVSLTLQHSNRDLAVFLRTYLGTLQLMFNTVPAELREQAAALSSLGVAINVLLDDIADRDGRSDLIESARMYMQGDPEAAANPEMETFVKMWDSYIAQISLAPRYEEFKELLMQEWNNLVDAMAYSVIVNTDVNHVHNLADSIRIASANMHHVIKHVVDMCHSPEWDDLQTAPALELSRQAQVVSRIGNWYKSWPQELRLHRDITSGVFAVACDWGIVTKAELLDPFQDAEAIIQKIMTTKHLQADGQELTAPEYLLDYAYKIIAHIQNWPVPLPFTDLEMYGQMLNLVIEQQKQGADETR